MHFKVLLSKPNSHETIEHKQVQEPNTVPQRCLRYTVLAAVTLFNFWTHSHARVQSHGHSFLSIVPVLEISNVHAPEFVGNIGQRHVFMYCDITRQHVAAAVNLYSLNLSNSS